MISEKTGGAESFSSSIDQTFVPQCLYRVNVLPAAMEIRELTKSEHSFELAQLTCRVDQRRQGVFRCYPQGPLWPSILRERVPRHLVPGQHGMRRLHPQVFVRQCRDVKRHECGPRGLELMTKELSSLSTPRKCGSRRSSTSSWRVDATRFCVQ